MFYFLNKPTTLSNKTFKIVLIIYNIFSGKCEILFVSITWNILTGMNWTPCIERSRSVIDSFSSLFLNSVLHNFSIFEDTHYLLFLNIQRPHKNQMWILFQNCILLTLFAYYIILWKRCQTIDMNKNIFQKVFGLNKLFWLISVIREKKITKM